MDSSTVIQIVILICLLALSAFFSSAETSLTMANKIRMRSLADEGNKRAKMVLWLSEHSSQMLTAILIGNNFRIIPYDQYCLQIRRLCYRHCQCRNYNPDSPLRGNHTEDDGYPLSGKSLSDLFSDHQDIHPDYDSADLFDQPSFQGSSGVASH